jgi:hypothetical protein
LREQAETGVFDELDQSEDNIDAMIDDYKKQLGLAVDMGRDSIKYRQGLKEKPDQNKENNNLILNKIQ